ncbi:hypothetical protein KKC60_05760 [Patescibacteria group bacterium]|nr:hypothetical protein [Patescibacteria group bacterium]
MNKKIVAEAKKDLILIRSTYSDSLNIGFDNWRGYRFIFDTSDVRNCKNDCPNCPLYVSIKKSQSKFGFIKATQEDKKIFGPQNQLNCKTLAQYSQCYTNFITTKINSYQEMKEELTLITGFKVLYSKNGQESKIETDFKQGIIRKAEKILDNKKRKWLQEIKNR